MDISLVANTLNNIDGWSRGGSSLYKLCLKAGLHVDVILQNKFSSDGISLQTNTVRKKEAKSPEQLGTPSVVTFHGRANPGQAVVGYRGEKICHFITPPDWTTSYWN